MTRALAVAALAVLLAGPAFAQELKKEFLLPVEQEASSTVVKVTGGTLVFLAGHTASVSDRNASLGNFEAQVRNTFGKIKTTIEKAGGSLDDIVSLSVYLTDLRYMPQFATLMKETFKNGYPAMTYVEVSHLARPESLLEVQPVAVLK